MAETPYARLRRALKAVLDEDAREALLHDIAPLRQAGDEQIAVEVINDYGDEVMRVFEV